MFPYNLFKKFPLLNKNKPCKNPSRRVNDFESLLHNYKVKEALQWTQSQPRSKRQWQEKRHVLVGDVRPFRH